MASHETSRPLDQENGMRQVLYSKGRLGKFLRVYRKFLSPTVGMSWYANTMPISKLQNSVLAIHHKEIPDKCFIFACWVWFDVEDPMLGLGMGLRFVLYWLLILVSSWCCNSDHPRRPKLPSTIPCLNMCFMNLFVLFHNMFVLLHMLLYLLIFMLYASKCTK